jgi:hypothetical protein
MLLYCFFLPVRAGFVLMSLVKYIKDFINPVVYLNEKTGHYKLKDVSLVNCIVRKCKSQDVAGSI